MLATLMSLAVTTALGSAPAQVDADAAKGYAEILAKYIKNGRVDYKALAEKDLPKLDAYLSSLEKAAVPSDKNAALGMYVDAYNAIVLRAVIENKRPRSVLDVKGFFDAKTYKVAGQSVTLDQLEKKVINPFAKDPRTHFVLVCGAVGCPILEDKPFAGSDVAKRMDTATRRYLASPAGAVPGAGEIKLSNIFNWYKADFGGDSGVTAFVKKHLSPEAAGKLGDGPKVSYVDYNWTLNQQ